MRIGIIGGGPAGLFAALLARERIGAEVELHERDSEGVSYGFGVEIAGRGLDSIAAAHPLFSAAFRAAARPSADRLFVHRGEAVLIDGGHGLAIARADLLRLLAGLCREAGVRLHFDSPVTADALQHCDLVIGADGVNSVVRDALAAFGTTRRMLTNRLAWYGTARLFDRPSIFFKAVGEGAWFWAVGYAYSNSRSTFVVECNARSWARSGLDRLAPEDRRLLAERLFRDELQGHALIENRSRWGVLPVIRNAAWHVGRTVLIGDALHSAHPTIGSGTRIAMEDAIALVDALASCESLDSALARFRVVREPAKTKLVHAADCSIAWYETLAPRLEAFDAPTLAIDYLLRTGRLDEARLWRDHPLFMARHADDWQRFIARQT